MTNFAEARLGRRVAFPSSPPAQEGGGGAFASATDWVGVSQTGSDRGSELNQAIQSVHDAGGGKLQLPFWVTTAEPILIRTGVYLEGPGTRAGGIRLGDESNCDVLQTVDYPATLAANVGMGPHSFGLRDLGLDGNRLSNAVGDVAFYGKSFVMDNVEVSELAGRLRSKWSEGAAFYTELDTNPPPYPERESFITRLRVNGCSGGGPYWDGPTDAMFWGHIYGFNGPHGVNIATPDPASPERVGVEFTGNMRGLMAQNFHVYGNHHHVGAIFSGAAGEVQNFQVEGAQEKYLVMLASDTQIDGLYLWKAGASYPDPQGVVLGDGVAFPTSNRLSGKILNMTGGAVVVVSEGDHNMMDFLVGQETGTVFVGTPNIYRPRPRFDIRGAAAVGDPGGTSGGSNGSTRSPITEASFDDAASGTLLSAYEGAVGTGFAYFYQGFQTTPKGNLRASSGVGLAYSNDVPPAAEYDVEADFRFRTKIALEVMSITARESTSAETMYQAAYFCQYEVLALYKRVAGAATLLGQVSMPWPGDKTSRRIRLICRDARKSIEVDGEEVVYSVDNAITAAGRGGIVRYDGGVGQTDTTGIHLANFRVIPA